MQPRIENISEKKLIGKKLKMTFATNRTGELWRTFMPLRREIRNNLNHDLVSMTVYRGVPDFFNFHPGIEFEKWAAVEVPDFDLVLPGMDTFTIPSGLYAVFSYKGLSTDTAIFQYIYTQWLPASDFELDDRPHFELLGEKYKNADPESEEEIWIPVTHRY